jgi:outer membrane protein assembly factor BamB
VAHLAGGAGLIAVVGDAAGRLAALDAATGKPAWEFDAGGGFVASPAIAAGHVVAASDDGTIWCFRSASK